MRIQVIQRPTLASIDGIRLDRFEPGRIYDVGTSLGSVLLAEGWAVPVVATESPRRIPLRDMKPSELPPNLIIERTPSAVRQLGLAADRPKRRRRRQSDES